MFNLNFYYNNTEIQNKFILLTYVQAVFIEYYIGFH